MMEFIVNRPKIEWVGGCLPYLLVEDFTFRTPYGNFHVPGGFRFDGASVPRIPFVYARYGGKALEAACLHDYLYKYHPVDRKTSDKAFLYAMNYFDNPSDHGARKAMYLAVRAGGRGSW